MSKTFTSKTSRSPTSHAATPFVPAVRHPSSFAREAYADDAVPVAVSMRLPHALARSLDDVGIRQAARADLRLQAPSSGAVLQRQPDDQAPEGKQQPDERLLLAQRVKALMPTYFGLLGLKQELSSEQYADALKASKVNGAQVDVFINDMNVIPKEFQAAPQEQHRRLVKKLEGLAPSMGRFITEGRKRIKGDPAQVGKKITESKKQQSIDQSAGPGLGPDKAESKRLEKERRDEKQRKSNERNEKQTRKPRIQ
jgi:hypothetical protein